MAGSRRRRGHGAREGQNRLKTWCLPPRGQHAKSLGTHVLTACREGGEEIQDAFWRRGAGAAGWALEDSVPHREMGVEINPGLITSPETQGQRCSWDSQVSPVGGMSRRGASPMSTECPNSPLTGAPASGPGFQSASSANLAGPRPAWV